MPEEDPWPDFEYARTLKAPSAILKEYGAMLPGKTSNMVGVNVKRVQNSERFEYVMYLTAPSIGSFEWRILSVEHDIDLYPATVYVESVVGEELQLDGAGGQWPNIVCASEPSYRTALATVFRSNRVKNVIASLMAQTLDVKKSVPDDEIPF